MTNNVLTSDKLLKSIKRRAMIPSDQSTFEDEDFLDMLNEEIQYFGIPHLLSTHEEYLVTFKDFDLEEGQIRFEIPSRAIGNKLREVVYIDNSNNFYELSRISVDDLPSYTDNYVNEVSEVFYLESNHVVLVDEVPFIDGKLRMYFYLKPNTLVDSDRTSIIQSIDTDTGEIIVSNFLNDFTNLPEIDFIKSKAPNTIYSFDITPSSVNSNTKTLTFDTSDLPDNLKVGDYINLSGETIVPQLPTELHPILAQRVAVAALESLGDQQGFTIASNRLQMMEKQTLDLIDNRVEGAHEKVFNRHGPLRQTQIGNYGYRTGRGRGSF